MEKENVLLFLKDDLNLSFLFENSNSLMTNVFQRLEEGKTLIMKNLDLRFKKFCATKNALVKYQKEKNVKICKQEKDTLDKTTALNEKIELLKKDIYRKECDSKSIYNRINDKISEAADLEKRQGTLLSEKCKVVKSLEKTHKAYACALAYYKNYLRMEISYNVAECQYIITHYQKKSGAKRTISLIKIDDLFTLPDGPVSLTNVQLMAKLCQERRKWLDDNKEGLTDK